MCNTTPVTTEFSFLQSVLQEGTYDHAGYLVLLTLLWQLCVLSGVLKDSCCNVATAAECSHHGGNLLDPHLRTLIPSNKVSQSSGQVTAVGLLRVLAIPKGEWLLQSAAGSAIGRQIIQIACSRGIRTINLVRQSSQQQELYDLGYVK